MSQKLIKLTQIVFLTALHLAVQQRWLYSRAD